MCSVMFSKLLLILIITRFSGSLFDNEIDIECSGKTYQNVTLTAYYPDYDDEEQEEMFLDVNKKKLLTLQDYLDDRNTYITLAMDEKLKIPYGTPVCIPELNRHFGHRLRFQVRDSSSDLYRKGYSRADVCVRSETDSYDITVNSQVTLIFEKEYSAKMFDSSTRRTE